MIRRLLVLFALLTLAFMSAAAAREHGVGHRHMVAAPVEVTMPEPAVPPTVIEAHRHAVAWLTSPDVSACSGIDETGHNRGKLADCACPAACAGLFGVTVAAPPLASEASAGEPFRARRLFAMSAAPPTPPPRA